MLEPESLPARQAARQAQLRRRRFIVSVATAVVALMGLAAVVAVAEGAFSAVHVKRAPARHVTRAPAQHVTRAPARRVLRIRPAPVSPTNQLGAIDATGDANIRRLATVGLPVYCGGRRGNEVAFTFDDGPGVYTHYAVKKLAEAHERATFFVVGRSMDGWPGWLPRELKVGAIGDHTYTHPVLTALSPAEITSEIERTKLKIERTIGQPVYLFRPPYGAHGPTVESVAKQLGLLEIMWSVDSGDSRGAEWAGIIRNVEAGLYPGAIILMHENRGQTIRALTTLLPGLRRRHLRSVSLPELFATDPPSVAQVRGGEAACGAGTHVAVTGG